MWTIKMCVGLSKQQVQTKHATRFKVKPSYDPALGMVSTWSESENSTWSESEHHLVVVAAIENQRKTAQLRRRRLRRAQALSACPHSASSFVLRLWRQEDTQYIP